MESEGNILGKQQAEMHKGGLDRVQFAVDNGFFLEALMHEYAAIEGRLEVILGILGFPCSKELDDKMRCQINISQRISCLERCFKTCPTLFAASKLDTYFFASKSKKGTLSTWIMERNSLVHGLFKDVNKYDSRSEGAQKLAEDGLAYEKLLYNEAARPRRISHNHPEMLKAEERRCRSSGCKASTKYKEEIQ